MRIDRHLPLLPLLLLFLCAIHPAAGTAESAGTAAPGARPAPPPLELPWRQAGLDERQAAAHLLGRLTFGPRPGEVDEVVAEGLANWLSRQLAAAEAERRLQPKLDRLDALDLTASELLTTYPNPGSVLAQARREGQLEGMLDGDLELDEMGEDERQELRQQIAAYAQRRGYRPQRELMGMLMAQKVYRAVYAENQLAEVLTDFWFNHFYVSLTDPESRVLVLPYERDAIRPHVVGSFRQMLGATARHPAMLLYLDNARSTAEADAATTLEARLEEHRPWRGRERLRDRRGGMRPPERQERSQGLNENYARELLELHTLGVDGGYTQQDVEEVARAFTGWTVVPPERLRGVRRRLADAARAGSLGFSLDGMFLFRADAHDAGPKVVLGHRLPAGRGLEDGEAVLDLLARHPATARHLAEKLAIRFVSDSPPKSLVDRLAATFEGSDGDLEAMMRTLVQAPEFWAPEARRAKIKSPFELAVSAVRGLGGQVGRPGELVGWIARMGQPLYAYAAPTGFPETGDAWVNTGALLNRMSFGLELAAGRIAGVRLDLPSLAGEREPESRRGALEVYLRLLLPGRELAPLLEQLIPVVEHPDLARRVADAAPGAEEGEVYDALLAMEELEDAPEMTGASPFERLLRRRDEPRSYPQPTPLEQVVGVILGSPEFQRR